MPALFITQSSWLYPNSWVCAYSDLRLTLCAWWQKPVFSHQWTLGSGSRLPFPGPLVQVSYCTRWIQVEALLQAGSLRVKLEARAVGLDLGAAR